MYILRNTHLQYTGKAPTMVDFNNDDNGQNPSKMWCARSILERTSKEKDKIYITSARLYENNWPTDPKRG